MNKIDATVSPECSTIAKRYIRFSAILASKKASRIVADRARKRRATAINSISPTEASASGTDTRLPRTDPECSANASMPASGDAAEAPDSGVTKEETGNFDVGSGSSREGKLGCVSLMDAEVDGEDRERAKSSNGGRGPRVS